MKEYDSVVLVRNKDRYLKHGVEKDMTGWICDPRIIENQRLVQFERFGALPEVATISVKEKDIRVIKSINRPIKKGDRVVLCSENKYVAKKLYRSMSGWIVAEKADGQWLVEFGRFDSMPELGDIFGNLPGLTRVRIGEEDLKVIAPVDDSGNEIAEFETEEE